jgi:hypothetical protein
VPRSALGSSKSAKSLVGEPISARIGPVENLAMQLEENVSVYDASAEHYVISTQLAMLHAYFFLVVEKMQVRNKTISGVGISYASGTMEMWLSKMRLNY